MSALSHEHPVVVNPRDIDFMGHVNNAIYLTWVQDAVVAHWQRYAPASAIASHVWIALKHEIVYRSPAFLDDAIVAIATLEQVRRESAFYETIVRRGDTVLAAIKSRWCCLDPKTLRPKRVAEEIVRHFLAPEAIAD